MAFRPYIKSEGMILELPASNGGSSQTLNEGDALVFSSGLVTAASSSTATDVEAIAAETKTVTTSGTLVKCYVVTPNQLWEADTDGVVSTVDVGTFADLASVSTINPDASSNDLFKIVKMIGTAESSLKVIGCFTKEVAAS